MLYSREGRVFPVPGPSVTESFWSGPSRSLLRRFVALAPRGATLEFAADRIVTGLQESIRELNDRGEDLCKRLGIDPSLRYELVSLYGTNVVYGNTIRDIDASARSLETQVPVTPLHTTQLTGHTPFNEVRSTLDRLLRPEDVSFAFHSSPSFASPTCKKWECGPSVACGFSLPMGNEPRTYKTGPCSTCSLLAPALTGRRFPGLVSSRHFWPC